MNKEQQQELRRLWMCIRDDSDEIEQAVSDWNEGKEELEEKFQEVETLRDDVNDTIKDKCRSGSGNFADLTNFLECMDGGPSNCDTESIVEGSILDKLMDLSSELEVDCGFEEFPDTVVDDLSLEIPGELENDYYNISKVLSILEDLKDVDLEPPVTLESLKVEVTELRGLYEEIQSAIKRIKEEE